MRNFVIKEIQDKLIPNGVHLIVDLNLGLYIYDELYLEAIPILEKSVYLFSTMN